MIEESFVSFDTARMLKEVGFDVPICKHYTRSGATWTSAVPEIIDDSKDCTWFPCPTQALAARWLREVHGMYTEIHHRVTGYVYFVIKIESNELLAIPTISDKMQFDIYEEAFENALRKAIKLIKK